MLAILAFQVKILSRKVGYKPNEFSSTELWVLIVRNRLSISLYVLFSKKPNSCNDSSVVSMIWLQSINFEFNYSRQHSVKQRILDADTKNSVGITGPIEEIAHNALAFCWNPYESPAKVID